MTVTRFLKGIEDGIGICARIAISKSHNLGQLHRLSTNSYLTNFTVIDKDYFKSAFIPTSLNQITTLSLQRRM